MYDDDEDADLRAAIAASLEQPQPEAAPAPASTAQRSSNPEVLTGFSTRFRCYAAAAVGRTSPLFLRNTVATVEADAGAIVSRRHV